MDEIVAKMGNVFNVPVDKVKAYRLGKGGQHPAPIKLCFDNEKNKNELLQAKKKKKITTKDLGYSVENFIYVDHDLTKKNQELYKQARLFKRDKQFKFIWIKNGKIYLREDEKSKIIQVDDLDVLKN